MKTNKSTGTQVIGGLMTILSGPDSAYSFDMVPLQGQRMEPEQRQLAVGQEESGQIE